ncbi:MAG: OmpA family protein [Myxococcota bacterium]
MHPRLLGLALACTLGGCVAQADYDALKKQFDDASAELTTARSAEADLRATLTRKIEEANARDEALRQQIADLNEQLSASEVQRAEQEQRLAEMVSDQGAMEASIQEMQEALAELRRRRAASERRVAAYRDLLGRFQALIDSGALQVKIIDGRMVVQMQTDVLFSSGSATLSADGAQAVADVAAVLAEIPDRRYQVEGHTDNVPISTKKYPSNWELASARALNVVQAMVGAGLSPKRVSAASFSEYRPTAANDSADAKAKNRRIEIVVVPNLEDLPGADELNRLSR